MEFLKEELELAVKDAIAYSEVGKFYGIYTKGGRNFVKLKDAILKFNIDTSHFLGKASRKGKFPKIRISEEEAKTRFVNGSKTTIDTLKRLLRRYNFIPYQCECGNNGTWRNMPLSLQIDHKNGKKKDQRIENLRWICPNCHTQTTTFAGRNKRRYGGMEDTLHSECRAERQ